jgi:hypothetical protein
MHKNTLWSIMCRVTVLAFDVTGHSSDHDLYHVTCDGATRRSYLHLNAQYQLDIKYSSWDRILVENVLCNEAVSCWECSAWVIDEGKFTEQCWNNTDWENRNIWRQACVTATLSTTNPTTTALGLNSVFCHERPATSSLIQGTAWIVGSTLLYMQLLVLQNVEQYDWKQGVESWEGLEQDSRKEDFSCVAGGEGCRIYIIKMMRNETVEGKFYAVNGCM